MTCLPELCKPEEKLCARSLSSSSATEWLSVRYFLFSFCVAFVTSTHNKLERPRVFCHRKLFLKLCSKQNSVLIGPGEIVCPESAQLHCRCRGSNEKCETSEQTARGSTWKPSAQSPRHQDDNFLQLEAELPQSYLHTNGDSWKLVLSPEDCVLGLHAHRQERNEAKEICFHRCGCSTKQKTPSFPWILCHQQKKIYPNSL